jgi:hypothetical protein
MLVPLFKHRKPHARIVGLSLRTYNFVNGQYFTLIDAEIKELMKIVEDKSSGIYIDPNQPTIDTDAADPISQLKLTMREQVLAELRKEGKLLDDSTSDQTGGVKGATSTASSTIMQNSLAEHVNKGQETQANETRAETVIQTNPTLSNLEKLKQGNKPA